MIIIICQKGVSILITFKNQIDIWFSKWRGALLLQVTSSIQMRPYTVYVSSIYCRCAELQNQVQLLHIV